jgi:predicted TIM-barrel fold metal-dependent hydrolase
LWKLGDGRADEDFGSQARQPLTYEQMRPGCYRPGPRLDDMDIAGIERSLCFPNMFLRFCGQTLSQARDRELALACITAYNDWMVEEWAAPSGGRLIPLCLVPLWDAELAAQEVRRNAERGVRAVTFSELPARLGLPSIHDPQGYWDPFFRACDETGTAICLHIGSASDVPVPEPGAPRVTRGVLSVIPTTSSLVDYLFSGLFERFSSLKVVYSESQIGWIPYVLERADLVWHKHVWGYDHARLPRPPSTYFPDHVFACFIEDQHGIASLDRIGADNVMLECDYPHSDSSWPDTHRLASRQLAGLDVATIEKITRGNAIRVFELSAGLS